VYFAANSSQAANPVKPPHNCSEIKLAWEKVLAMMRRDQANRS